MLSVIPKAINDQVMTSCANFRTKHRFPSMTYFDRVTGCSIWRSSQACYGLMMNRNGDDERVLAEIGKTNVHYPENKLNIFDARSNVAAHANRFKGGGIENVNYYTNCEVHFCDIANIHGVRDGIEKMYNLGQTEVLNNP